MSVENSRQAFDAINDNNLKKLLVLLSNGLSIDHVDVDGVSLFHYAIICGSNSIARFLISRGAKINTATISQHRTPLHTAFLYNNKNMIELILEHEGEIKADKYGFFPGNPIDFNRVS